MNLNVSTGEVRGSKIVVGRRDGARSAQRFHPGRHIFLCPGAKIRQTQAKPRFPRNFLQLPATFRNIFADFCDLSGNSGHQPGAGNTPHADRSNHRCLENARKFPENRWESCENIDSRKKFRVELGIWLFRYKQNGQKKLKFLHRSLISDHFFRSDSPHEEF